MTKRIRYWKFLVHAVCIILIGHTINESSLNYTKLIIIQRYLSDIKHILLWTDLYGADREGQRQFFDKKCEFLNCYITKNKSLLGDVRYFDAIVFNVKDLAKASVPKLRGYNQKYIFAANDSADKYPVCNPIYDAFFNWTWTYRPESTISYRFISVYNTKSQELGSHFQWNKKMLPIERNFQALLTTKSRAAAVFLDQCKTRSNREGFIEVLKTEMSKYNMNLDIFGDCGTRNCRRKTMNTCSWRLRKQYFFFLALEESIAVDFVSREVLPAYQNKVVPIVYGGADYSQYLPPGSYLDAMNLTVPELVKTMYASIQDRNIYHNFFKWRNHYRIRESPVLDICALCKTLNRPSWLVYRGTYTLLRKWWYPGYEERCGEENWF